MRISLISFIFIVFTGCSHLLKNSRNEIQSSDINDYIYLETSTGIYNGAKSKQDQIGRKETVAAIKKLNSSTGIAFKESSEEEIEKQASAYIAQGQWKSAFDTLIKYEPVLTQNKNLINQIIYVSLKIDYYDYAIDQLKLEINQNRETSLDKEVILAHAYYLSQKYDLAQTLYSKIIEQNNDKQLAQYLFLVGYKLNNLKTMTTYLNMIGDNHPDSIEYHILTAKVELIQGQIQAARDRLKYQSERHPENQDIAFEYVNTLIEAEDYKQALAVLDYSQAQLADTRQYHFMKSYIYHKSGHRKNFQRELASTQVEKRYEKLLTHLFLQKRSYADVYDTIFQKAEFNEYKFNRLVKQAAEQFAYSYIYKTQLKDAILVREEFRPMTEPLRLPSGLEFSPSK